MQQRRAGTRCGSLLGILSTWILLEFNGFVELDRQSYASAKVRVAMHAG